MQPPEGAEPSLLQLALYPIFAAIGGLLGYLMRSMDAGARITLARALLEMVSAGFAGVIVLLMCEAFGWSMQWAGVASGIFGWIGATASLRWLESTILKPRLGGNSNDPPRV